MTKLEKLRNLLKTNNVDCFIIPSNDAFMSEFVHPYERRLEWITGFTGSSGTAIVTQDKALFFTDGRYTIQAEKEVQDFEIYNIKDISPYEWINKNMTNSKVGFDIWLHTENQIKSLQNPIPLEKNLIDEIWEDRPTPEIKQIIKHDIKYAGKTSLEKRKEIAEQLETDALIITAPDSICWLLNIRGFDTPYTPFCLCYAVLYKNTDIDLFIDLQKIPDNWRWEDGINVFDIDGILDNIGLCRGKPLCLPKIEGSHGGLPLRFADKAQLDTNTPYPFTNKFPNAIWATDPCSLAKAVKNPVEIEGIKNSHKKDGIAVTKFLEWLEQQEETTEQAATNKLEKFRQEQDLFQYPSFETVSAFGENAAMIHYRTVDNAKIKSNGLYLVDSGGQYLDGTTDITRTVAIGTPTDEQKQNFTRVLKGHIALAKTVFPEGTTGLQLDAIARYNLWQVGLDYEHGTGHGVGYFLSVHESPPNITRKNKAGADLPLKAGMILSNEPGYYKKGEYGIRIENMMLVVKSKYEGFLEFETLTKAPIDKKLIEFDMLTEEEKQFIDEVF